MGNIRRYSGGSVHDASGVWSMRPLIIHYWFPKILSGRRLSPKHCTGVSKEIKPKNTKSSREIPGIFEHMVIEHRLIQCLGEAHESSYVAQILKETINNIDTKSKNYMAQAESKCRNIKSGKIPFSPESTLWIKRQKTYSSLMAYNAGNKVNKGNLKRSARKIRIRITMQLSIQEISKWLKVCK